MKTITCNECGVDFTIPKRRGRPPVKCEECREKVAVEKKNKPMSYAARLAKARKARRDKADRIQAYKNADSQWLLERPVIPTMPDTGTEDQLQELKDNTAEIQKVFANMSRFLADIYKAKHGMLKLPNKAQVIETLRENIEEQKQILKVLKDKNLDLRCNMMSEEDRMQLQIPAPTPNEFGLSYEDINGND